jgi:WD40 repeat protein
MESKKIGKKSITPDSVEKFQIDWHPKPKERLLAISGRSVPIVLKSGAWTTTPLPHETETSVDGNLSVVKWSIDGALIAAVSTAGTVQVYDFSPITGPVLKIRALSETNTIVSLAWGYAGSSHVVNCIGLKGVRTCLADNEVLKKDLKIDLASLLTSAKEAAAGNIESGLVEEDAKINSADDSEASSSGAESVDESPEQLQEELNDLLDNGEESKDQTKQDDADKSMDASEPEDDDRMYRSSKHNISIDRQFSFQPGATVGNKVSSTNKRGVKRKILCWNQFGSVVRTDFPITTPEGGEHALNEEGLIEVHLETDSAPMKQFRLKDSLHGWSMASLGNNGLALAVKSRFDMTDRYEDDLVESKKNSNENDDVNGGGLSKVCYRPFTSWGNQREWIVPLPLKAEVESVAAGASCLAAIATDSTVRVWSNEGGFLLWSWNMKAEVPVSICASGDFFFAASVMRSRNTESLQFETFLTLNGGGKLALLDSGSIPITATPGTALCWIGVSEDFVPFTCDTQGVIRGLFPFAGALEESPVRFQWVPLLNFVTDYQRRGEGYWPLFISEKDVWCVPTRAEDDYEPRPAPLPPVMSVALRAQAQFVADRKAADSVSAESSLFMDRLLAAQTRLCAQLGLPASAFKTVTDGDLDKAIKKGENAHDKKLADTFRKLLEAGKLEKALGGAALAFQSMTSRLMIRMAAALGMRTLEARLEDLFNPSALVRETAAPAERRKELSAAETLFPQASSFRASPRVDPADMQRPLDSPVADTVGSNKDTKPSGRGGPVNPFAKKRANEENQDSGNKMARNA